MSVLRLPMAVLGLTLLLAPTAAPAQQDAADPVVARVNGEEVRQSEVFAMARSLPAQYQAQVMQLYPLLLERVIDFRLATKAGRAAGLANDPEVKARMARLEDEVIRNAYLERELEARVTEEDLQARYEQYLEENPPATEHRARHILVETEDEAVAIIAELDEGADFAELAKERSTGPSGSRGGDLGYFTADQMVPEFSEAAAALDPGEYSDAPTQTQFGWHVIKVEDRRTGAQPAFEDVESDLRDELSREIAATILSELRADAEIEIISDTPVMDETQQQQ